VRSRTMRACARLGVQLHRLSTVRMYSHGSTRPDHLTRTAEEPRGDIISEAHISDVREITSTVRELTLKVADPRFSFAVGNWVDVFIEGVEKVGGYSMTSTPQELPTLRLAVKRSKHPPAAWVHSEDATVGATVQVKAGGRFGWTPDTAPQMRHLLLVAGGIGINPLFAIMQAVQMAPPAEVPRLERISLLYSASRPSELAYLSEIEQIARSDQRVRIYSTVTRNSAPEEPWGNSVGRIDAQALDKAIRDSRVATADTFSYVCGPPAMTDDLVQCVLEEAHLPRENVFFEKWW